jgi:hypothetical protein
LAHLFGSRSMLNLFSLQESLGTRRLRVFLA